MSRFYFDCTLRVVLLAGATAAAGAAGDVPGARPPAWWSSVDDCPPHDPPRGPDVAVAEIPDVQNYASVGGIEAFSIGTISCNIGDLPLDWIASQPRHPVIAQNLFRLQDGRFEQVGMSWLKHGFVVTASKLCCSTCDDSGDGTALNPGCADPYDARLNGAQIGMGPRFEVNPDRGTIVYPFTGFQEVGDAVFKRLQVEIADLDPQLQGGGMYFAEAQYVAPDDAAAGNQDNNASHRQIHITGDLRSWEATFEGMPATQRGRPAIRAWQDQDSEVIETDVRVPGEGLLILAAKVTRLGGGYWHYEYALHNLNSERAAGAFEVPRPPGSAVERPGFHDVRYHSGEPFDGTDWLPQVSERAVRWSTDPFEWNPDANALRWGTLYNFRFECNVAPGEGQVTIDLFKPGTPVAVFATTRVPAGMPPSCGDGRVSAGEECDPPDNRRCDVWCQRVPRCGDGLRDGGETCDPPDAGRCSNDCRTVQACGNGLVEPPEECDPPNGMNCDNVCGRRAVCGDGVVFGDETCDPPDGMTCAEDCRSICRSPGGCNQPGPDPDAAEGGWCGVAGEPALTLTLLFALFLYYERVRSRTAAGPDRSGPPARGSTPA